jgi:hypothetical protein
MKRICATLALFAVLLSACSLQANAELTRDLQKWQISNITHYRFDLSVACFCAFSQRMPLAIEVQNGKVTSMKYNDGTPVIDQEQKMFEQYGTIDALFNFTRESIAKADEIQVQYDPKYGYPSSVKIDFIKNAVDDELGLTIQSFEPLP